MPKYLKRAINKLELRLFNFDIFISFYFNIYTIGKLKYDFLILHFLFANGYMNRLTYLYQNGNYWSMSPYIFNAGTSAAVEFFQDAAGNAYYAGVWGTWLGLRPVSN